MTIFVNNTIHNTSASTLGELMAELQKDKLLGIAVALNQTVIPRSDWENYKLREKDTIIIITATQGG